MIRDKVSMKKAKSRIYDLLLYSTNERESKFTGYLKKIWLDKIKYIKSHSANSTSKFTTTYPPSRLTKQ